MRAIAPVLTLLAMAVATSACKPTSFTAPAGAEKPAASAASPGTPATAAPLDADDNLNAVLWVQRSAEYQANSISLFRAAADHLDVALKEANWDALVPDERELAAPARGLKPAVIMDIDFDVRAKTATGSIVLTQV